MDIRHMLYAVVAAAAIVAGAQAAQAAGEGARCGGASANCDGALWCDPRPGRCASPRPRGRCVAVPQVCTMIYQPVCGCDGNTYANDCVRRSNRVGKNRDGAC